MPFQISLKPTRKALIGLMVIFFACNTSTKQDASTQSQDTTTSPAPATPSQEFTFRLRGNFDTLYTFKHKILPLDKNNRLIYIYTFKKGQGNHRDTLTMHGWSHKRPNTTSEFDRDADDTLQNGNESGLSYGPGTYFENLVITSKSLKIIQDSLRNTKADFIIFAPEVSSAGSNHIQYRIFVSKEHPLAPFKAFAPIPTDQIANPSPPRNR